MKKIRIDVLRLAASYGFNPDTTYANFESDNYGGGTLVLAEFQYTEDPDEEELHYSEGEEA